MNQNRFAENDLKLVSSNNCLVYCILNLNQIQKLLQLGNFQKRKWNETLPWTNHQKTSSFHTESYKLLGTIGFHMI